MNLLDNNTENGNIEKNFNDIVEIYKKFKNKMIEFEFSPFISQNLKNQKLFQSDYNNQTTIIELHYVNSFSSIELLKSHLKSLLKLKKENVDRIFIVFLLNKNILKQKPDNGKDFSISDMLRSIELNSEILKNKNGLSKKTLMNHSINESEKKYDTLIPINSLKKTFPLSKISDKNALNDLSSREWLKFTKTWFIHNPPQRRGAERLHPAKYPEDLVDKYIKFFSKKGEYVFDPFLGVGSTIVAALRIGRNGYGFELSKKYYNIAIERCKKVNRTHQTKMDNFFKSKDEGNLPNEKAKFRIFNKDSRNIMKIWKENDLPTIDVCVTSPPYWNQLKKNSLRQRERQKEGLDTIYSENKDDIGNIDNYKAFLKEQQNIFKNVHGIMKDNGHLVVITNNVYADNRMYPLAFDTVRSLEEIGWIPLDEQIWCQNDKALRPLAIFNKYMGNRCHQYCLIFQKR